MKCMEWGGWKWREGAVDRNAEEIIGERQKRNGRARGSRRRGSRFTDAAGTNARHMYMEGPRLALSSPRARSLTHCTPGHCSLHPTGRTHPTLTGAAESPSGSSPHGRIRLNSVSLCISTITSLAACDQANARNDSTNLEKQGLSL